MNMDDIKKFFKKYVRIHYAASYLDTYITGEAKFDLGGHGIYEQYTLVIGKSEKFDACEFNLIGVDAIVRIDEMNPNEIILYKLEHNL